jgi:glycosyltransferase involved in cell wall biosynthesis
MAVETPLSTSNTELKEWVHIPTPGDHYSPATGSAVITVIAALAEAQSKSGIGIPKVLVSNGTMNGYPPYPGAQILESSLRCSPTTAFQKLTDIVLGRLVGLRPFTHRLYEQLLASIERDFSGVLIVHNQPGAIVPLRRFFPKATLTLYLHNDSFTTYSHAETLKIIDAIDSVICCSKFLATTLTKKICTHRARKVKVVLNGIDPEQFKKRLPRCEHDQFPLNVLFVGRMLPEKGPDLLLKAAAILQKKQKAGQTPPFRVRLIGSSNFNAAAPLTRYERHLRNLAFPLGKTIEFRPFVKRDKIPKIYQDADIFVAPSNWDEPFGLTIAEAMASGLPCIVSNRGGIPEVARDAALYFTPPHPEQLAEQLENLLLNTSLRTSLGGKARARALELDWDSQFDLLLNSIYPSDPTISQSKACG